MEWGSVIGLILAVAGIIGGQYLEGGHIGSLVQLAAFVIVFFGTIGAVVLQMGLVTFLDSLKIAKWTLFPPRHDGELLIRHFIDWSTLMRKEGVLALERVLDGVEDNFSRDGLRLVVDMQDVSKMRDIFDLQIQARESDLKNKVKMWESAGGYSPTIGILGAVLGLIHVMENLADPSKLGGGIAVAFVATIYGVGLANLVFLPMANNLKRVVAREIAFLEMQSDAFVQLANGESWRMIEARLRAQS